MSMFYKWAHATCRISTCCVPSGRRAKAFCSNAAFQQLSKNCSCLLNTFSRVGINKCCCVSAASARLKQARETLQISMRFQSSKILLICRLFSIHPMLPVIQIMSLRLHAPRLPRVQTVSSLRYILTQRTQPQMASSRSSLRNSQRWLSRSRQLPKQWVAELLPSKKPSLPDGKQNGGWLSITRLKDCDHGIGIDRRLACTGIEREMRRAVRD